MFKNLLTICLLISLCANDAAAQELKNISLGYPSLAFTQSHIWVAKEKACSKSMVWMSIPSFCAEDKLRLKLWPRRAAHRQRRQGYSSQPVGLQLSARSGHRD